MKTSIATFLAISLATGAASAQANGVCYHAGDAYSVGSGFRMGDSLQVCRWDEAGFGKWTQVAEDSASVSSNCVMNDNQFGHGSLVQVDLTTLVCANGRWFKEKN